MYYAATPIAAPILGAISDRIGRRPVLAVSQMGSAAGYVLLGIAAKYEPGAAGTANILTGPLAEVSSSGSSLTLPTAPVADLDDSSK